MAASDRPYLSIVAASRNDDHGGDPLRRTQIFVNALFAQCQKYRLPAELILVDWNPPADRPGLAQALSWSKANEYCPTRAVQVPRALHARLRHAAGLPLFQMIAKNAGIRRARGDFVLATNIDILFSDELMAFVARQQLNPDRLYRVDRYDAENQVPLEASVDEQLAFCWSHLVRFNLRSRIVPTADEPRRTTKPAGPVQESVAPADVPLDHLHTMACGDFTLLSRRHWHRLRGYPEFEAYSFHLDSLFCYMGHYGGVLETFLTPPAVAFHIEHSLGSGWSPEGEKLLFQRLQQRGIPCMSYGHLEHFGEMMRRSQAPIVFNTPDWGLGHFELDEFPCGAADEAIGEERPETRPARTELAVR